MLWLTEKTVETHVSSILGKLGLSLDADTHRRVLAVVTYLRGGAPIRTHLELTQSSLAVKNPPKRAFLRADEGTRTLDLLHGKQTL